jgi:hypothetical protein
MPDGTHLGRALFTITSALNASPAHSRFSAAERLAQTWQTVQSVRAVLPQADILIFDGSTRQPDGASVAELGRGVGFSWYGHLPELQQVAQHSNFNIVKNVSELTLYARGLGDLIQRNALSAYQRVFKLSGRYWLNPSFDAGLHFSATAVERFVFSRRTAATWDPAKVGTRYAWQTRLFSFDPSLAYLLGSLYMVALRQMHEKLAQGIYTDIEHSLARYLNPDLVLEVDAIGVSGEIGTYSLHIDE